MPICILRRDPLIRAAAEAKPPKLFAFGKDSAFFPSAWVLANDKVKRMGRPLAAGHTIIAECVEESGAVQGPGLEALAGGFVFAGKYDSGRRVEGAMLAPSGTTIRGTFSASGLAQAAVQRGAVVLDGRWDEAGKLIWARLAHPAGVFEGQVSGAAPHGTGRMAYASGAVYEGEWRDGQRHGAGTLTHPGGFVYVGHWADDRPHGPATLALPSSVPTAAPWHRGQCTAPVLARLTTTSTAQPVLERAATPVASVAARPASQATSTPAPLDPPLPLARTSTALSRPASRPGTVSRPASMTSPGLHVAHTQARDRTLSAPLPPIRPARSSMTYA